MLLGPFHKDKIEAGVDEAGRGPLAGGVWAAAVIFAPDYENAEINDSKKLSERTRERLRTVIERDAVAWAIGICSVEEVDRLNILQASIEAMHRAIAKLRVKPEAIIVDGNRFNPYGETPYRTIVGGDAKYLSIAAASILAKTYRDKEMLRLDREFPMYGWAKNKGYPTIEHRRAIRRYGISPYHRKSFRLTDRE